MYFLLTFLHVLVNIVGSGRSTVRVFILIAFLLIFGFIFYWSTKSKEKKTTFDTSFKVVLFSVIGILFLLGIGMQLGIFKTLHIPEGNYAVFVNDREITTTTLVHTHIMKVIPYELLHAVGIDYAENVDIGSGIATFLPIWFIVIAFVFFSLFMLFNLYAAWRYFPVQEKIVFKIVWSILFVLTQFALTKTIIDGGLFSEKVFVWLVSYFFLISRVGTLKPLYKAFFCSWLLVTICNGYFAITSIFEPWQFEHRLYVETGITLVILACFISLYRRSLKRVDVLVFILGILFLVPSVMADSEIFYYSPISIIPTDHALVSTYSPDAAFRTLFKVGPLSYQEITSTTTVGMIINKMDILDNFFPISVPWTTCVPSALTSRYDFSVASDHVLTDSNVSNKYYTFTVKPTQPLDTFYRYNAHIEILACTPRHLNLIQEVIRSQGAKKFFLYNVNGVTFGDGF